MFWCSLCSPHVVTLKSARSNDALEHDRRTYEATIRPTIAIAPGRGCTGLELRQGLECARPTARRAAGVQLAPPRKSKTERRELTSVIAQLVRAHSQ